MKRFRIFFLTLFFLLTAFTMNLNAGENKVSGSASFDLFSNYVWRGQKLSEHHVYQPSVGLGYRGFGVNLWGNYDDETKELTELDLTASYSYSYKIISLEAGYINYAFDGAEDTQEVYGSVGLDIPFNPSVAYYYDYDVGDGGYLNISLSESVSLNKVLSHINIDLKEMIKRDITLNVGGSVGVNLDNEVLGFNDSGEKFSDFYDGNVSVSLDIPIIDKISVSPIIGYSFALSDDAETAIRGISFDGDKDVLYGGVSVSFSF